MISWFVLALVVPTAPPPADAPTTLREPITLATAVEAALAGNPSLLAAIEQRQELTGGVAEAWSDAYPQLDLVGGWNRTRNPSLLNSPDFEELLAQFPGFEPSSQDLWNLAVELRQVIWAGGKVKATVELAKLASEIVESRIATARLDVAAQAARSWAQVVSAQKEIEALEAERASRDSALAIVEARLEIGEATELERLRAVAARRQLDPQMAAVEGRRDAGLADLKVVLGLGAAAVVAVAPVVDEPPAVPERSLVLAEAISNRPELLGLDLDVRTIAGQAELVRAESRPRFDFAAAWGRQARLGENLGEALYDDWRVGFTTSWSLSDGGKRAGQLVQLESQQRQTELRLAALRLEVEAEVERAWVVARAAAEERSASREALVAAREAARVARESWEQGVALQLDVLQAEDLARQAELATIQADLAAWSAAIDLARARGTTIAATLERN